MEREHILQLVLFLTEIKIKESVEDKYKWEIERQISLLKEIVVKKENNTEVNKSDYKELIPSVIGLVLKFFGSS